MLFLSGHARIEVKRHLLVLLAFVALFAAMYPSLLTNWKRGYLGGSRGDAAIYIYAESVNSSRFFTPGSEGFDLPIFYPWKRALAFSDNFLLPSLISKIISPITGSQAISYNLILVTALCLNGLCAYLLCLNVSRSRPAAVFGGFVFMCFPYYAFHRGHPQLQFAFWIPMVLLSALKFADNRSARWACGIGGSITGAFFCAVYYSMYCYLLAGVALLGCFLLRPSSWRVRDLITLLLANLMWLLLLIPAAIPYLQTRSALGTNPFSILRRHSPWLSSFIAAPWVEDLWARYTHHFSDMEGFLFFGMIPLLLCCAVSLETVLRLRRGQPGSTPSKPLRWCCNAMILMLVVSVARGAYSLYQPGSRTIHRLAWIESEALWGLLIGLAFVLWFVGRRARQRELSKPEHTLLLMFLTVFFVFATLGLKDGGQEPHRAPELYRWLIHLPGFDALRGLSRMGLVAVLCAAALASVGVGEALERRKLEGRPAAWLAIAPLFLLSAAELHTRPEKLPHMQGRPKVYEQVSKLPTDEPFVALPIRSGFRDGRGFMMINSTYMMWARNIKNPMVNGFSGKVPPFHATESDALDSFPSRKSLSLLGTLVGVRYVVTNNLFFSRSEKRNMRAEAEMFKDEVEILSCDKSGNCVFRVNPVIYTKDLPAAQLLVAPSAEELLVELELQRAPGAEAMPGGSVSLEVLEAGIRNRGSQKVDLPPAGVWQSATVTIPKSAERVSPTAIKMSTDAPEGIVIRNVSVRPSPKEDT